MKLAKIFLYLQSARLGKDISLPLNSLTTLIGSGCYFLVHLLAFSLIIENFRFPNWSTSELWVLFFTFETYTYLVFFLLWTGLIHTVRDIWQGKLEIMILKPTSSRFLALFRSGSLHNLVTTIVGLILLIWTISQNNIQVTALSMLGFVLTFTMSVWVIHCLSIIFISMNFFVGRAEGTSGAIFQFQETMKYPATAYSQLSPWVQIFVLPTSLLTTVPAMILLGKSNLSLFVIYGLVLVVLTIVSDFVWKKGLRNYSSASS